MKNIFKMLFLSIFLQLNCVVDGNAAVAVAFTPTRPYRNVADTPMAISHCGLRSFGFCRTEVDTEIDTEVESPSVTNFIDVQDWDGSDFLSIISNYFSSKYKEIKEHYDEFQDSKGKHMSVAQIIIRAKFEGTFEDSDDADIRVPYVIPFIFVSGKNGNLYNEASSKVDIYKGLEDFQRSCSSCQIYAHSEVALGACLSSETEQYSLKNIVNAFKEMYPTIQFSSQNMQIIIQIKNAHNEGSCPNCRKFLSGISYTDESGKKLQSPKRVGAKPFDIGSELMGASGVSKIMVGSTASGERGMHSAYFVYEKKCEI